ncbi:enoyl-CoA hydratase/isomerase family protein [Pseudonocardia sp. GCM10023141]|uniref:enoyl-CoA hydratase/isomerase family protein n=1 Tax=Pseudonocardia sp. GCM10023141 TaxID=3252653 RepID=UPI00360E7C1D
MDPGVTLTVTGAVATVTIDRPATRNAIDRTTMAEFGGVLDVVEEHLDRGDVRVVAVRGGGDRVFISGGDLKELAQIRSLADAQAMSRTMRSCLDRLATLPAPTVALLNGHAMGGGAEVAVACDMRLAADDIRIAFNQVALGIMPAWGGVERLTGLVGRGRALQLLLTGTPLTAAEAGAHGLVETVVPRRDFDTAAAQLLAQLAAVPAVAGRGIKALVGLVAPPSAPEHEAVATTAFAHAWVAEDHWAAAAAAEAARATRPKAGSVARAAAAE